MIKFAKIVATMIFKPGLILYRYLNIMQFDIHSALMHWKLNRISGKLTGRWLDIGAGNLPYKKYFANTSEYLTTNTKRHYAGKDLYEIEKLTTYWIEDGKSLPLPDSSLDGVACFQVLSVIDRPEDFFKELCRVLKPGGELLLTTDFLYPVWSAEDRYRHSAFNLRDLAEKNGFGNIKTESFGGFGSTIYSIFMRYLRSFPEIWKGEKPVRKLFSGMLYLLSLLFLPFLSLAGMLIYLLERNSDNITDFTFNIFLSAKKQQV
jgi:SAM-dependent methyltransferase